MPADHRQEHRVVFLGAHNWRAHESMRWWNAEYTREERAAEEAGARRRLTDVFGIARPEMPVDAAKHLARLQWLALRPGSDVHVAEKAGVEAVVCSGQGPNDVQVAKDCRAAGKAVFVESLERFSPSDLAEVAAGGATAPLMAGLYLRHDAALQAVAEMGIDSTVGRPLLYQAHASTLTPSLIDKTTAPGGIAYPSRMRIEPVCPTLFDLGIQQVDALRWLLKTEPTEVYAVGSGGGGADMNAYDAVTLTIKTSSGALAVITLDAAASSVGRQRVQIVGDQNRVSLPVQASSADLQTAGISHFMDVVTAGAQPRLTADDVLRAAAAMAAVAESLRSGVPAPVDLSFASSASPTAAPEKLKGKLVAAAASLVQGARALVHGNRKAALAAEESEDSEGGVSTPPHQGTPPPKAVGTPESPALLPIAHHH